MSSEHAPVHRLLRESFASDSEPTWHDSSMSSTNFAAARERVLARQATREALERARHHQQAPAFTSPVARLPFPLSRAAGPLHFLWTVLQDSEGTRPSFRVGQVDAELLDAEIIDLLKGQAAEGLKYFGLHIVDDWSQEIVLALRAVLFKLSIWDHDASYGAVLQNLRYIDARSRGVLPSRPSRWQKSMYGAITVLGRYAWVKWESWLLDHGAGYSTPSNTIQLLLRATSWLSTAHSISALMSFLVFLVNGRYRSLSDRLLRLRLASPSGQSGRDVSFEYLNRQLVWHAFTEFLLFLFPLVGITRWRRWLGRVWRKMKTTLSLDREDGVVGSQSEKTGPLARLPEATCAICYQDQNPTVSAEAEILGVNAAQNGNGLTGSALTEIVNPYETLPCRCIYCYVCIVTKLEGEEEDGWTCLRCGEVVKRCKPWAGDVIEPRPDSGSYMTNAVGFADHHGKDDGPDSLFELEPRPQELTQERPTLACG